MTLTIPTTPAEWAANNDGAKGPCLLVSRDREGLPRWVGCDKKGYCESFDTLDGALLFAVGFLDTAKGCEGEYRSLYDKPGAAKLWFEQMMRKLEAEERGDPNWESVR